MVDIVIMVGIMVDMTKIKTIFNGVYNYSQWCYGRYNYRETKPTNITGGPTLLMIIFIPKIG